MTVPNYTTSFYIRDVYGNSGIENGSDNGDLDIQKLLHSMRDIPFSHTITEYNRPTPTGIVTWVVLDIRFHERGILSNSRRSRA